MFDHFSNKFVLNSSFIQFLVLHEAFNAYDVDHCGSISTEVVGEILETLDVKLTEDELDDIIDEFDEDESGELDFHEFIELAKRFIEPEVDYDNLRKELREAFMLYDKDGACSLIYLSSI